MKSQAVAYQIAEGININSCKTLLTKGTLIFSDRDELFFDIGDNKYLYIFRYGVLCTYNFSLNELEKVFQEIDASCIECKIKEDVISESLEVNTEASVFSMDFNGISLVDNEVEKLRLIMLNLSQSIALDHYAYITEKLLVDTQKHTSYLEEKGRLDIGGKTLKRYIGKVLNVKNKISENLYIFDSPEVTWDSEVLNKLNIALKRKFDFKDRYQVINQQVNIVKDNLELFKDIMDHRESSRLEWIIIILIVIEVIDMFVLKLV